MEVDTLNAAYTTRTTCRVCPGTLIDVLSLGPIHISTFPSTPLPLTPKVPIDLMQCNICGLFQLRNTVSGEAMYSEYWYKSGLNEGMVRALKNVAEEAVQHVSLQPGDILVDIGTNDGTLLAQYNDWVRENCWLVGYEPSNLAKLAINKGHYILNEYFNAAAYHRIFTKKAKIITSIAMFYDLEDPHTFVEDAKNILDDDGVWIIQLMDLLSMVRTNDFPNLCAEHLEYYTLGDIALLMAQHGLQIFDVDYNKVNGASLRVYVAHQKARAVEDRYFDALTAEHDFFEEIGNIANYFKAAVEDVRSGIVSYVKYLHNSNKKIAVLGASTKGNTLLEFFELGPDVIDHAAEINEDKFGKFTTTGIPIISESESLARHPDYYLILPWGVISIMQVAFKPYLESGGAFIVPLPEPTVVDIQDGELHVWPI